MRTSTRLLALTGITIALLALPLVWGAGGSRLWAAGSQAPAQNAFAQATLTPPVDHAAHHASAAITGTAVVTATEAATAPLAPTLGAAAGQAVTGTAALSATMPMSGSAMGGMMGAGMMGMMGQMAGMHEQMASMMGEMMNQHADVMTPEMGAEMGRMMGMMESMGAAMNDMSGMMGCAMVHGGVMHGGMTGGHGMMGGSTPMMPMTGTMPMSGTMQGMPGMAGMMGMMRGMQADMVGMMQNMPAEMAARMQAVQAQMGGMMSVFEQSMFGQMQGGGMGSSMPMTGTMSSMGGTMNVDEPFDAQFIDSMIEHHQGAVAMADQALDEAGHDELRAMAEGVIAAQQAEIEQMQAWRAQWYPDLAATAGTGMAMGDMMLSKDTSVPFDRRFIQAMISHHQGAIMMAGHAQTAAEHEEVRRLAEDIISAQEGEIAQMQEWNAQWYPDLPPLPDVGSAMPMGDMGDMAAVHAQMEGMREEMQAMMDDMLAGGSTMMTPEMAAQMGRMMGRMEGMSGMMAMMPGGMMDCAGMFGGTKPGQ